MNLADLRTVQRLARMGNTEQAWKLFESSGLASVVDKAEALNLKGRLTKDLALKAEGPDRAIMLRQARSAYLSSAALRPSTYPLINAATLALLAGDHAEAMKTAGLVLAMLDSGEHEPETEYWLKATRAEAFLLGGKHDEARRAMADAVHAAPAAWEDHASTLRHFQLILASLGAPSAWLDSLRPPPTLHFSGTIHLGDNGAEAVRAIEAVMEELHPGFGFGALAAGSDIVSAEVLINSGAELHVVLPTSIDAFRQESVGQFGSDWIARFDRLLDAATTVETLPNLDVVSEAGILVATQTAMALAIRQSRTLEAHACALRVGTAETGQQAIQALDDAWEAKGLRIIRLDAKRSDRRGRALPALSAEAVVSVPTSAAIDLLCAAGGTADDTSSRTAAATFTDPAKAAREAMKIAVTHHLPVGIHYGAFDPAAAHSDRFEVAALMAVAAPPGRVFLSRAMALALTLKADDFDCEDFGHMASPHGDVGLSILTLRQPTGAR